MFRRLLFTVVAMLAAGSTAAAALGAPPDDARAAADRFLAAFAAEDANTACGMLTARALGLIGGLKKCTGLFANDDEPSDEDEPESSVEVSRAVHRSED